MIDSDNISLIGGSGFIGSFLLRDLKLTGKKINIFDKKAPLHNENIEFVKGNILDKRLLEESIKYSDVLINLAAEHADNVSPKSLYYDVNVEGSKNICDVARNNSINNIIFISSVAVYGFSSRSLDEDSETNPFNDYGITKLEAEKVFINWQKEAPQDRKLIIVRPTAVFGINNRGNIFNLINQLRKLSFFMIGNGSNKKSIAYVENLTAFIKDTLNLKNGCHIFNYVDKPDFSMRKLVYLIKKTLGVDSRFTIKIPYFIALFFGYSLDILGFFLRRKFQISAIRIKKFCSNSLFETSFEKIGFEPPYELEEALEKTILYEFEKKNLNENIKN